MLTWLMARGAGAVAGISTTLSTAALDKHPQSKERGITLDLGFSSFTVPMPARLACLGADLLQVTLVDCPGHASLIRTIVGGASIIDMMLLVIDVRRGIQAQTAECLVIAELATDHLLVALNKVDLLPEEGRERAIKKAKKKLAQTFGFTRFAGCTIVPVAAKPGGGEGPGPPPMGLQALVEELIQAIPARARAAPSGPFLFSVDHCFAVKGQGTVLTGTALSGKTHVGDTLELPELGVKKKVKSIQMFRRPVDICQAGDRAGICVTQLDANLVERGLACTPGSVPSFSAAIAVLQKIRFYPGKILSKQKVHLMMGHETVLAQAQFFGLPDGGEAPAGTGNLLGADIRRMAQQDIGKDQFDMKREYIWQDELYGNEGRPRAGERGTEEGLGAAAVHHGPQWALLRFQHPVSAPADSLVIGAKLDANVSSATCRLAFSGRLVRLLEGPATSAHTQLLIYKTKQKSGRIERVLEDGKTAICHGMLKKESDISLFCGMKVKSGAGEVGTIEGSFGKKGKFKVHFPGGVSLSNKESATITLSFKRYMYDETKRRMVQ
eukprot:jgi/Botrbrau1/7905/Bobra.9_2s0078.2